MIFFYIEDKDLNDATSFYVNIIQNALEKRLHESVVRTNQINSIDKGETVLAITIQSFLRLYMRNPKQRIILWIQGVCPEESLLLHAHSISKWPRYWAYQWIERLALRKASFLFFVSKEMRNHYRQKYGYTKGNYYVMPCFNQSLNANAFQYPHKYENPSFVYAGSLSRWQCVEETLQLFAVLEKRLPQARFTILTGEVEKGKQMCADYGVTRVEVKYVPLKELDEELSRYKYGLLLREEHVINRVATPNKFNTYLASGLIPIYSDVIKDFVEVFPTDAYCIRVADIHAFDEMADQIQTFETRNLIGEEVKLQFSKLFATYYSVERYEREIAQRLSELC